MSVPFETGWAARASRDTGIAQIGYRALRQRAVGALLILAGTDSGYLAPAIRRETLLLVGYRGDGACYVDHQPSFSG